MPSPLNRNVGGLTIGRGLVLQSKKPISVDDAGVEETTFTYLLRNENYPALVPARGTAPTTVSPESANLAAFAHLGKANHRFTHNGKAPGIGTLEVVYKGAVFTVHSALLDRRSAYIALTFAIEYNPAGTEDVEVTVGGFAPTAGLLRVGDAIVTRFAVGYQDGLTFAAGSVFIISSVAGSTVHFRVAGGSGDDITFLAGSSGVSMIAAVALAVGGEETLYVGPTADMAEDDPITLSFVTAAGGVSGWFPTSELAVQLYVTEIVDAYHIKASATVGGSNVVPSATNSVLPPDAPGGAALYVARDDDPSELNITAPYFNEGISKETVTILVNLANNIISGQAVLDYYALERSYRYVCSLKPALPLYVVDPYLVDANNPAPVIAKVNASTAAYPFPVPIFNPDLSLKEYYSELADFRRVPCGRFWEVTEVVRIKIRPTPVDGDIAWGTE